MLRVPRTAAGAREEVWVERGGLAGVLLKRFRDSRATSEKAGDGAHTRMPNFASYRGRRNGTATLVHCRVGVSRSATICIAEVMRSLGMSFPRAYCFVRARRLNVIIQPHLRFAYELLKWEEHLFSSSSSSSSSSSLSSDNGGYKRELEWPEITREVALLNKPYAR
ncbi:protein-tyrosine phosphatase-like protein [Corynascus novoguineensis]|uniref:Protein-tyrosine phosphatase-like protein n=1 Tax=Corynascus novoguineensis TaxID=1126955 RepID=A0AAN7CWT4_9PEZI|nr:protein-tyrosine phosphatase-like protein [Corynascus novoguineensis]